MSQKHGSTLAGMHYAGGPAGLTRDPDAYTWEGPGDEASGEVEDYDDWDWMEQGR